jgi:hypothetical protein
MTLSFSTKNFFKFGRAEVATKEIICKTQIPLADKTREGDDDEEQTCPVTSVEPSRADSSGWNVGSCFSRRGSKKCQHSF